MRVDGAANDALSLAPVSLQRQYQGGPVATEIDAGKMAHDDVLNGLADDLWIFFAAGEPR